MHYKKLCHKCMPSALDDFHSECVHDNINKFYAEGRKKSVLSRNWLTVVLPQLVNSWGLIDILPKINLKQNY